MGGLLRKLCIWICIPIYKLIRSVYWLFYNIANTRFLNNEIIQQFSSNIYVLVSVVMLFGFSITILSAIVNPDLISDNKKGVSAMFKRAFVGLALMIIIPFGFNELYTIQEGIMKNSVIEKIVVGVDMSCSENDDDCEVGGNGGQVIAGTLISSVLYPQEDSIEAVGAASNVAESYSKMITEDIDYITNMASNINATRDGSGGSDGNALQWDFDDESYAFHFDGLIAIIAGGVTVYILILFAIDVAVRVFKLAFLELTAPISIVGYIAAGDKILNSWLKEVGKTYASLFIKIATMAFYLFLISNLSDFVDVFTNDKYKFILKVFLMIGMLIFVKQLPEIIKSVLGIDIGTGKGGIGGRLGEMAMVGKQAQKAWGAVKNLAPAAAAVGALGAVGAGLGAVGGVAAAAGLGGVAFGGKKLWKDKLSNTKFGSGVKKFGGALSTAGRYAATAGKSAGAFVGGKGMIDGIKQASKSWNDSDAGATAKYNKRNKDDLKHNDKMGTDSDGIIKNGDSARVQSNWDKNIKKDVGETRATAIQNLHNANKNKAIIDKISGNKDSIVKKFDDMIALADTQEAKSKIADLKQSFDDGTSSTKVLNELENLNKEGIVSKASADSVAKMIGETESLIDYGGNLTSSLKSADGGFELTGALKGLSADTATRASNAKSTYDSMKNSTSDEDLKAEMDRYVATSDAIVAKSILDNKSSDGAYDRRKKEDSKTGKTVDRFDKNSSSSTSSSSDSSNSVDFSDSNSSSSEGLGLNIDFGNTSSDNKSKSSDFNDSNSSSSGGLGLNIDYGNTSSDNNSKFRLKDDNKPNFKLKDDN